jgi:hypothetical protein
MSSRLACTPIMNGSTPMVASKRNIFFDTSHQILRKHVVRTQQSFLGHAKTYRIADERTPKRNHIDLPTFNQLLRFAYSILLINHKSSPASRKLHEWTEFNQRLIPRLQTLLSWSDRKWDISLTTAPKVYTSSGQINIAHATSHDVLDQVCVDFRHFLVGDHRAAHEICRADFEAYAIVPEDGSDCVNDFESEAAFVLGGTPVGVGPSVEVAGMDVSEASRGEEEGHLRAKERMEQVPSASH